MKGSLSYKLVPLAGHAFNHAVHFQVHKHIIQLATRYLAGPANIIVMLFCFILKNGYHAFFFVAKGYKHGALLHGRYVFGCLLLPSHNIQYISSIGDQMRSMCFNKLVAAGGVGVVNSAGYGKHIAVIAAGYLCGN